MDRVDFTLKQEIFDGGQVINFVYFPEDCVCSLVAKTENLSGIEVGMFGAEGMSNMVVRPGDRTALSSIVQVAGSAWRIDPEAWRAGGGVRPTYELLIIVAMVTERMNLEAVMAQYYLHQRRSAGYICDLEGAEFDDVDQAREEAIAAARELLRDGADQSSGPHGALRDRRRGRVLGCGPIHGSGERQDG